MHAFLVEGKLLSDVNKIRDMWANHFEALGTPFASSNFDNDFYDRVTTRVQSIFINCAEDTSGVLNEPLQYEEVAKVCSRLKRWSSDVLIDYEHALFAGPPLWKHLFVSGVFPKRLNLFDFENWNYLTSFQWQRC